MFGEQLDPRALKEQQEWQPPDSCAPGINTRAKRRRGNADLDQVRDTSIAARKAASGIVSYILFTCLRGRARKQIPEIDEHHVRVGVFRTARGNGPRAAC